MFQDSDNPGTTPPPRELAPGALLYTNMIRGGMPHRDAQEQQQRLMRDQQLGGMTPQQIEEYWGIGARSSPESRAAYQINNQRYTQRTGFIENVAAGWNMSAVGLMLQGRLPDENVAPQGFTGGLGYAVGQFGGDFAPGVVGGLIGAAAGGGTGAGASAPTGGLAAPATVPLGAVIGAGFGAGALPEGIRQYYIGSMRAGEAENFGDWANIVTEGAWSTAKSGAAGAVGGVVGQRAGAAVGGRTGSRAAGIGTDLATQGVAEVAALSALELRMPTAQDFATAAVISLAAGGVTNVGQLRNGRMELNEDGRRVQNNLQDIFVATGMHPNDVAERARTDPAWRDAILAQNVRGEATAPVGTPRPLPPPPYENTPRVPPYQGALSSEPTPVRNSPLEMQRRQPIPPMTNIDNAMRLMAGSEGSSLPGADRATSPAGARGRYQIMPDTARQYGFDPARLMEPAYNTQVARAIMTDLYNRYGGDEELMLTAYNAGPGRANQLRDKGPGTRLVAIRDPRARNGWRFESEPAARDESWLPLETEMYLARARTNNGGELPGSRGGSGRLMATLPPGGAPPGGGDGGGDGGGPGRRSEGTPDWALPVVQEGGGDGGDGGGNGRPPAPPEPPGDGPDGRSDDDLFATLRENISERVDTPPIFDASRSLNLWVSELEPARSIDTAFIRDNPEFNRDRDILAEDMARFTYSSDARASIFLREGSVDPISFDVDTTADTLLKASKIAKEKGGNLDDWFTFMAAQRSTDKEAQGQKTGFDQDAARELLRRPAVQARYEKATEVFNNMMTRVLEYGRDSGTFSQAQVDAMVAANPTYVSFRREMGGDASGLYTSGKGRGAGIKVGKSARNMEGSDRKILDPKLTTIDNVYTVIRMADRNKAIGHIVAMAEGKAWKDSGLSENFQRVDGPPEIKNAKDDVFLAERGKKSLAADQFVYYRDGQAEVWQAKSPELAALLRGVESRGEANIIDKTMSGIAAVARAGIVFAPDFAIKVSMVDQIQAFVTDPLHPPPFVAPIRGVLHALGGRADKVFLDWMAKGGAGSSLASMDANYIQRDLHKIFDQTGVTGAMWNAVKHPLELAQIMHERVDAATRVGYYKRAKGKGLDPRKAAIQSRKAYLDFAEGGTLGFVRAWARWVPFLRPAILGSKQLGEALHDPTKGVKRPATTAMYLGLGVVMPTVVLYVLNAIQDESLPEERQWKNRPDWERDMYFLTPEIAGVRFKLRKPHVIGVAAGAFVERFLDHMRGEDPEAFKGLVDSVMKDIIPPLLPPATVAPLEQVTGYDFFTGRPLIPASLENVSGYMQYTPATTETAKKLSRLIAPRPAGVGLSDVSPIVIENYAREWTGSLGMLVLKALDIPYSDTKKPWELSDIPFIQGFVARRTGGSSADPIQQFYEEFDEYKTAKANWSLALSRGDEDEMTLAQSDPRAFVNLQSIGEAMSTMSEVIRGINADPDMTPEEKRQLVDQLYGDMIDLANTGRDTMRAVRAADQEAADDPMMGPGAPSLQAQRPAAGPTAGQAQFLPPPGNRGTISTDVPSFPTNAPGNPNLGDPLRPPNAPQ